MDVLRCSTVLKKFGAFLQFCLSSLAGLQTTVFKSQLVVFAAVTPNHSLRKQLQKTTILSLTQVTISGIRATSAVSL